MWDPIRLSAEVNRSSADGLSRIRAAIEVFGDESREKPTGERVRRVEYSTT